MLGEPSGTGRFGPSARDDGRVLGTDIALQTESEPGAGRTPPKLPDVELNDGRRFGLKSGVFEVEGEAGRSGAVLGSARVVAPGADRGVRAEVLPPDAALI